ncbi:hypothetical protein ACEPAI_4417 [Sanghuangporus weigelae]
MTITSGPFSPTTAAAVVLCVVVLLDNSRLSFKDWKRHNNELHTGEFTVVHDDGAWVLTQRARNVPAHNPRFFALGTERSA